MLKDSPEFSFGPATMGKPPNPLLRKKGLENNGITDVGGTPDGKQLPQSPDQLIVPDVVSATDPAYTMHPAVRQFIQGLARTPAATSSGSPWTQVKTKALRRSELISGLGMDLPYEDQGASLGR